jgi:soluble lytic murein transglycosylase-like protein
VNLLHLRTNLRFGCTLLRHFLDLERGDLFRALARYHEDMQEKEFAGVAKGDERFADGVKVLWESRWAWKA